MIATAVVTVMYLGLCDSIAEMSPALPHTGGAYSFGRTAMGPWGGFVTGLAENMEYVLTPAVIVVGIGGYLGAVFGTPEAFAPAWWLLAYVAFVGLNVWGVYFPKWLSLTHRRRETPHVALVTGAVIGFLVALALHFTPRDGPVGAALLNMAVFGAVIAYVMQMLAFVLLRKKLPEIERPYRSRTGVAGAVVSGGIALVVRADGHADPTPAARTQLLQVETGAEGAARAGQDHDADRIVARNLAKGASQCDSKIP